MRKVIKIVSGSCIIRFHYSGQIQLRFQNRKIGALFQMTCYFWFCFFFCFFFSKKKRQNMQSEYYLYLKRRWSRPMMVVIVEVPVLWIEVGNVQRIPQFVVHNGCWLQWRRSRCCCRCCWRAIFHFRWHRGAAPNNIIWNYKMLDPWRKFDLQR